MRKKVFIIIKITKNQKDYLLNNGCKWGTGGYGEIHATFTKNRKYYATECSKVLRLLSKYKTLHTVS